jgi:hypothetical protein
MVAIVFQSAFLLEIHRNNIFYFLKFIFGTRTSKEHQNDLKTQKKNLI